MTIHEMRCIYPGYAAKERELEEGLAALEAKCKRESYKVRELRRLAGLYLDCGEESDSIKEQADSSVSSEVGPNHGHVKGRDTNGST